MAGQVQFKADRFGMVHVGVGKVNFANAALLENIRVLMVCTWSLQVKDAGRILIFGIINQIHSVPTHDD